jgi:hypothetical protein
MSALVYTLRHPASWFTANNPVLYKGQQGEETDTGAIKTGDGTTAWNELIYFVNPVQSGPGGGLSGNFGSITRVRANQTVIIPEEYEAVVSRFTVDGILTTNGTLTLL